MRSVAHHSELWGLTGSRGLTLAKRGWLTHGYLHVSDLPAVTCPFTCSKALQVPATLIRLLDDFDAAKAALHCAFARSDRAMGTSWRVGQSASAARVDRLTN